MILAGDIGGTNTRLALFEVDGSRLRMTLERVYPSRDHKGLREIVEIFVRENAAKIDLACFGIAGPVIDGRVATSNLPWIVSVSELSQQLGIAGVWVINDLHAHASGIDDLEPATIIALNQAAPKPGNSALIAAGTGLGQAGLYWDGTRRYAFPCEGGHSDFAPRNDIEIALLQYLQKKFGRVSYERVLSGPGLQSVYEFLRDTRREDEPDWLRDQLRQSASAAAVISHAAIEGQATICERALDIFVSIYGAEAGNLALKIMATGGMYVSGGIAAKILPRLQTPEFLKAFISKGRLQPLMETIPLRVIVNDNVGLIGAARYAALQRTR